MTSKSPIEINWHLGWALLLIATKKKSREPSNCRGAPWARFTQNVKKPPLTVNIIGFDFFGFNISIWVPWSHLGPKKSWYNGTIIKIHKRNKAQFAPCLRYHWNHHIEFPTFLTYGPLADKQQKMKYVHPFFVVYPLEGQRYLAVFLWGFFTFLAILAYCAAPASLLLASVPCRN